MKKPSIELKNNKYLASLSEETHAYTATIYVNGKRFAEVSNRGHGAMDDVRPFQGGYQAVNALNKRIAATYPKWGSEFDPKKGDTLDSTLEIICGGLVNDWLAIKEAKKILRKISALDEEGDLVQWPAKLKPTPENIARVRAKFPEYTILNDLHIEDAAAFIFKEKEPCPES